MVNLTAVCIADIFATLLAFVTLGARFWRSYKDKYEKERIRAMLYTVIVASLSDMFSYLVDGVPGVLGRISVYGTNTLLFLSNVVIGSLWITVLIKHIRGSGNKLPKAQKILAICLDTVGVLALIVNFFCPLVYKVDSKNTYHRGPLFFLFIAMEFIFVMDGLFVYLVEKKKRPKEVHFPVAQYLIPIFAGAIIQSIFYGVSTIWPGISIAICGIIFGMYNEFEEEEEALRQREGIIKSLSVNYDYVCYIDLKQNEITASYLSDQVYDLVMNYDKNEPRHLRFDRALNSIILPEDYEEFRRNTNREKMMADLKENNSSEVDFRVLLGDRVRWYRLKVGVDIRRKNGVVLGIYSIDFEKKAAEALASAYKEAEAANEAKTKFLFNMSHDIRTPMNAIIGFNNMAEKNIGVDDEKAKECLRKSDVASETLLTLINDVLEMSRIEAGKIEIAENKCDILQSLEQSESMMKNLAAEKNLDLEFSFGEIRDRYVIYDYAHTNRILINIISNAVKYTESGGRINVCCEQLSSDTSGTALYRFTVEDNGIGMSEEFQKHLFEQFTRERNTTVSNIQGTGLGLALCKSLADAMDATITCESKKGVGSKFTFVLPCKIFSDDGLDRDSSGDDAVAEDRFKGKKILIVEDNEMNREIASDILSESGFEIDMADDGTTALDKVKEKGPDYFDAILMDIQMPVMDGYTATSKLRELYPDSHMIIIALSANAFEEDKKKSLEAGMDWHISKPINVAELKKTLSKFI